VAQLFNLQFVKGEANLEKELDFSRKDIRLTGPRGKILDCNGLPLAYNQTSYSVQFMRDPSLPGAATRPKYTQSIMRTIDIVEKNGGKTLSTFAIHKMDDGSYQFFWPGLDSEANPKTYAARIKKWKDENCSNSRKIYRTHTPEEIYNECRTYYGIPASVGYDEAFKILSVWQEVQSIYFSSYIPVTVASSVDMNTVAEIEIRANELIGMQISQTNSRVYPNKTMAAHIIGYMGRMLDENTIVDMGNLGYHRDDLIGVSGIEASEETELSGDTADRSGTRVVEVDNLGKVVREITSDNKDPKPGNNVMLTIDSKLQKVLEKALQENIDICRAEQDSGYRDAPSMYEQSAENRGYPIQWASVGAAVVMEAQTGRILAMASYPSFDPNLFNGGAGMTQADYDKFFGPDSNHPRHAGVDIQDVHGPGRPHGGAAQPAANDRRHRLFRRPHPPWKRRTRPQVLGVRNLFHGEA
jgi:penicillin-binding protein 2